MSGFRKAIMIFFTMVSVILLGFLYVRSGSLPAETPVSPDAFAESLPEYAGEPDVIVNDNHVMFESSGTESFLKLSEPDHLGRVGEAIAVIGPKDLTFEDREPIGSIRPTGWQTQRYDDLIEDKFLYNRCHLIAYVLSGLNDEEKNLFTGTRYLNVMGMLPWEITISSYIETTGNHVEYHVRPIFVGNELVCRGVLLQAMSAEDQGESLEFCVYCFNVQPGVVIDYTDGSSEREVSRSMPASVSQDYILNTNTMRFHLPECENAASIKEKNRKEVNASRDELIEQGYQPCGACNP